MTARVREIGVKIALGATRVSVVEMVVRNAMLLVVTGVLLGLPCALATGRLIRSQLYGVAANDSLTLLSAVAVFMLAGFIAAVVPGWRAASVDPMIALRAE